MTRDTRRKTFTIEFMETFRLCDGCKAEGGLCAQALVTPLPPGFSFKPPSPYNYPSPTGWTTLFTDKGGGQLSDAEAMLCPTCTKDALDAVSVLVPR